MEKIVEGMVWYVAFVFSVVVHEAAHALAALKLGDPTAYHGGQVTLDPWPHIKREPIGTVAVPIVSFLLGGWMIGWASTPYDPFWARRYPQRSALMSLAGPLSNLILIVLSGIIIVWGLKSGFFFRPGPGGFSFSSIVESAPGSFLSAVAVFISILFSLNVILFAFNLLPLPPMDGSNAVVLLLSEETTQKYLDFIQNPIYGFIGLFIAWNLFGYVLRPIFKLARNLVY
ncbi:MAG: site-2 protease family protein [Desulfobacteraceae bacterium]|nr:MAG: site-2 protease family protein [Desulfobacteraceae bacterium]